MNIQNPLEAEGMIETMKNQLGNTKKTTVLKDNVCMVHGMIK